MKGNILLPHNIVLMHKKLISENKSIFEHIIGLLSFFIILFWFYRIPPSMWNDYLPSYGDPLEALWQIEFWRNVILSGTFDPIYLSSTYPIGLHQLSVAHAGIGFLLTPISLLFGSGIALNFGFVSSFILCFVGSYIFISNISRSAIASYFCSIVYVFALGRTLHIYGHLHMLWASTFGVWMGVFLIRLCQKPSAKLAAVVGVLWAAGIISHLYMVFMGAVLVLILNPQINNLNKYLTIILVALVLSAPYTILFLQSVDYMQNLKPSIYNIALYSSDFGSYIGWGPTSNWRMLFELTRSIIQRDQQLDPNVQTWGITIIILSICGYIILIKRKHIKKPLTTVLLVSFILSLGPVWVNPPFKIDLINQASESIWRLGAHLKPEVFKSSSQAIVSTSWPLPAFIPLTLIPFFESARIPRRYAIWVGLISVALAGLTLSRLPKKAAFVICCLWVVELLPTPIRPLLIPTQPHPAHAWAAQRLAGEDKGVHARGRMVTVYSQYLAGHLAGTAFVGSFTPKHIRYMLPWRNFTAQALVQPELVSILRRAQVGIVLTSPEEADLAKKNTALRFVQCFEPGVASYYYPSSLCAFEVLPRDDDFFNIQPVTGFSDFEENVVGIEDSYARAGWRTSRSIAHILDLELQPCRFPHGKQSISVKINGQVVASHTWASTSDERWKIRLMLAPSQIVSGWNTVELLAADATLQSDEQAFCDESAGHQTVRVHRLRVLPFAVSDQRPNLRCHLFCGGRFDATGAERMRIATQDSNFASPANPVEQKLTGNQLIR